MAEWKPYVALAVWLDSRPGLNYCLTRIHLITWGLINLAWHGSSKVQSYCLLFPLHSNLTLKVKVKVLAGIILGLNDYCLDQSDRVLNKAF